MAGQDVDALKSKIKNIIIKVIISSVPTVTSLSKSNCKYRHTCHELFGFDIFLDHHLKPWLIEVEIFFKIYSPGFFKFKLSLIICNYVIMLLCTYDNYL